MKCLTTEQTKLELRSGNQLGGVAQRPGKVLFHTFKPVILFLGMGFKEKRLEMTKFHKIQGCSL